MNPFQNFAWWQSSQRWYARRYVCPYWGHKPYGEYGWAVSFIGKFDKQASVRGTCENCGDLMPHKLEDLPADATVAWFGRKWDAGCTENIHVYAPEGQFCHECIGTLGPRDSGVVEKNEDGVWAFYYDPSCWGEVLAVRNARETLDADDVDEVDPEYADRPHPKDW